MSGSVRVAPPAADRDAVDAAPWIVDESAISSWHLSYDSGGRVTADAEPLSNAIRWAYDARGLLRTVTNARGVDLVIGYDAHGLDTSYETAGADDAARIAPIRPRGTQQRDPSHSATAGRQSANTAMGVRVLSRRGLRSSR